jgi:hypothetical protein
MQKRRPKSNQNIVCFFVDLESLKAAVFPISLNIIRIASLARGWELQELNLRRTFVGIS